MVIPPNRVSGDTLKSIVEEFISREGTDYGYQERSFESKVDELVVAVKTGRALILFDPASETTNIVDALEYEQMDMRS